MKIVPRDYQSQAVDSLFSYFRTMPGNPLVAMPTGTGKSICIADFCERFTRAYQGPIYVLTHVKELVDQNFDKMMSLWPQAPAGINSAGLGRRDVYVEILFAGIGSIHRTVDKMPAPAIIIIDEAHLVSPSQNTMYRKVIEHFKSRNPFLRIIGFTATPWRLGQGMLTEGDNAIFTDICFDITGVHSFVRLIQEGYLCPLVPKRMTSQLDITGVNRTAGDFNLRQLQEAVNKDEVTQMALAEAIEHAGDRNHWLVFSSGLEHAESIGLILDSYDISNVVIHSRMSSADRDEAIRRYKSGEVRAAINYGVLTTGFDFPEIDCIVVLRPTESPVLWVQMLGRGTRPLYASGFDLSTRQGRLDAIRAGGKENCLVLDFARNTARLGPINDPRVPRAKGKGTGVAPIKVCTSCDTYNHASARHCGGQPYRTPEGCGHEFPAQVKITSEAETKELIKVEAFPEVVPYKVHHVSYNLHHKRGSQPSVKVTYFCNDYGQFSEYICFQHSGAARYRAQRWWKERSMFQDVPKTTEEALETIGLIKTPSEIRVIVNRKYPEIVGFKFGEDAANSEVIKGDQFDRLIPKDITDDDIPF